MNQSKLLKNLLLKISTSELLIFSHSNHWMLKDLLLILMPLTERLLLLRNIIQKEVSMKLFAEPP